MRIPFIVFAVVSAAGAWFAVEFTLRPLINETYAAGRAVGFEAGLMASSEIAYDQGFEAGIESGQRRGRSDLAHELIMACIAESADPSSCTMEYEAVKNRPSTITIGGKQLFCRQSDAPDPC